MDTHNSFRAMILDGMEAAPPRPELPKEPVRRHTCKENMFRLMRHEKPYWIPAAFENNVVIPDVVLERPAMNKGGKDWFGVEWKYVENIHAPCTAPGFVMFEEAEEWRSVLKFPDLDAIDWERNAELLSRELDPDKANSFVLFNGCFERLHSLMGFENALCAMLTEPEEISDLINAIADFKIRLIDKLITYYPVDTIVYHDDWGTNDNTFFSVDMYEELLFEPTKRIVDFVHSKGKFFTLHCCGRVEKLVPYMLKLNIDSWESAQMNINNLPEVRQQVGNRLGMEVVIMNETLMDPDAGEEAVRAVIRNVLESLGGTGPLIITRLDLCAPENMYWVYDEFYKISASIYAE